MPGTYGLDAWLDAAERVYHQAVQWRDIRPERLAGMGGVFFLAAGAVWGWNARTSDNRETARRAAEAWEYFESEIRDTAAQVGPDRAVESYFGSPRLRDLARASGYEGLTRAQSTEELQSYGLLVSSPAHGQTARWQFFILDWDSYVQRTLATLTAGPGSAAIAGGVAVARGGPAPTREDWEAGVRWADLAGTIGTALQAGVGRRLRSAPPVPSGPPRPVAAEIRPAREPVVVKPKERGVTKSARGVERGPRPVQGPRAPKAPPASPPETTGRRRQRARTSPATPSPPSARRRPGSSELPVVEAATRAGLDRQQTAAVEGALRGVMNNLPTLIGRNRLAIWREKPTRFQRNAIVDHAGAVVSEHLMEGHDFFAQAHLEARDLAMRAGLGSNVRIVQGVSQAQTGTRYDIGPAQQAPPRSAPHSSQLGDRMLVIEVNQPSRERHIAAKDLYVLGVAEAKLASQVGELAAQLSKTHERLEGLGVRVGNDVYIPAEHAKPGQNRLFTAADLFTVADLRARTTWIVAAPHDARKSAAGWRTLQQDCDRAVGQPAGSVRVIRLPLPNAAIRRYAEHLLDLLTES